MDIFDLSDEYFMDMALKEARVAFDEDEIPVGAVITCGDKVIAKAHNSTEQLHDATAHAEMLAITSATGVVGGKYLNNCTLYVTLEPCVMCAGALAWTQIGRIVFGASDPQRGYSRLSENILHPKTSVAAGLKSDASELLLKQFFEKKRKL